MSSASTPAPVAPSFDAVDDLAWVAAVHDLRDPLHTAASFLDLLAQRSGAHLDEDGLHCLDQASRAVQDSLSLVRSTLEWSRAGFVRPEPTDSAVALADARRLLADALRRSEAHVDAEADLPWLQADPAVLRRIFQNLVSNSIRHGGPRAHILVGARRSGRGWWLDVIDDGPGIPPGVDLFAPFQRGSGSTGTGLGLAYVQRAVQAHGGRVEAGSAAPGGARVSFWLPATHRPTEPKGQGDRVPVSTGI